MPATRSLCVIADDYGIGRETSRAILELAQHGAVTGTVLLVNAPDAEESVRAWQKAQPPADLGWHPCLTLDAPVAPAGRVRSLVGPDGNLWPLGKFLTRLALGLIRRTEIERELRAQYGRFLEMVGHPPAVVNSHQHTSLFPPVGACLRRILAEGPVVPYLRRVREPWSLLATVPGARIKRFGLTLLGRVEASRQRRAGFPGADWLAGITDPLWVSDDRFFARILHRVPGREVELICHPGHYDESLVGRDCTADDGLLQRRIDEERLLRQPAFLEACKEAGFALVRPSGLLARLCPARHSYAA